MPERPMPFMSVALTLSWPLVAASHSTPPHHPPQTLPGPGQKASIRTLIYLPSQLLIIRRVTCRQHDTLTQRIPLAEGIVEQQVRTVDLIVRGTERSGRSSFCTGAGLRETGLDEGLECESRCRGAETIDGPVGQETAVVGYCLLIGVLELLVI